MNLFEIPYYKFTVTEWSNQKDQILSMVPFGDPNAKDKNITFTDYFNPNPPMYGQALMMMLDPYLQQLERAKRVTQVWCQRYKKGDFFQPHDHGAVGYSAVFYAELHENHTPTTFFSPFADIDGFKKSFIPEVNEGDFIIFPASITHMAAPNYTDFDRTIFSFNII